MIDQISRYRAGMRRYVAAITHSQEDERKRISRDLHDDTVQALVAIGQRIDLCRAKFGDGEDISADLSRCATWSRIPYTTCASSAGICARWPWRTWA